MSITEDLAAVVTAADSLTQEVTNKISSIDQRVTQFNTDANNIVNTVTGQMKRANIGIDQQPYGNVTPTPEEDTGLLVKNAFAAGHKHIRVFWPADGQERHWNTKVVMPVGTTLTIEGDISNVGTRGGSVRTDRACYANGSYGGTSDQGSPMIFRNLEPSGAPYPENDYYKVSDEGTLIDMLGNNILAWGHGTYVHDQGGMTAGPYGSGLIRIIQHQYGLPSVITGAGYHTQFYLSGSFVNHCGGASTCEIRMQAGAFNKLTSDGPPLEVDKGFRRLLNKGVAGVTSSLLTKQPCEITETEAGYNDNLHSGASWAWFSRTSGIEGDINNPRMFGVTTWALSTGYSLCQFNCTVTDVSMLGLHTIPLTNVMVGAV